MNNSSTYTLNFQEIDKTQLAIVGGKGANLGELIRIEGIRVPDGFCISTEAFKRIIGETPSIGELLDRLSLLKVEDRDKIRELSGEIRLGIEGIAIPQDIVEEIAGCLTKLGENDAPTAPVAYAVRSSATAEDLPTASFAGQQDTYLNIIGKDSILASISKCWASLFTERAVIYRLQNGFDHRKVNLAVVVQKMVFPQAAGILFTADPVNGNRKVSSIDAGFGLGEAMVSGLVNPDIYKVRDGRIIDKKISTKKLAIYAAIDGNTKEQEIEPERQNTQALTDEQILELERIGRKIEEHFAEYNGGPQDIEWCLVDNAFYIVQSRPITTLFPIPEANDQENHVYISVGHQQMMTDAMKPLGLSLWRMGPFHKAGGRLFVDVAKQLASPAGRENLLGAMGQLDPLLKDALMTIIERGDFISSLPGDEKPSFLAGIDKEKVWSDLEKFENDPTMISDIINGLQAELETLKQNIERRSGTDVFDLILEDLGELKKSMGDSRNLGLILAAVNAAAWINENIKEWLGEKGAADMLSLSAPNNITSEMGLDLLDVADVARPYPEAAGYLQQHADDENLLDKLIKLDGGQEVKDAIGAYLEKYGMRCAGEIDITRSRWSEKPAALIPLIVGNIKIFEPGERKRKVEQGLQAAERKERELLERLEHLPGGPEKAEETKRVIALMRSVIGYREYPKYAIINRYFVYKQALMREAERLVSAGVVREKEDVFYLTFEEFREAVRTNKADWELIRERKEEHKLFEKLTPPRVITSEGEIGAGRYKRDHLPAGSIVGLAVSSGVIEGRARVILKMEDADLDDGDILVTAFTDPSWTPLFVSIKGLVTEVGGLMTHGAVIAREYGLPAVVGVENATKLIKDGQRIRVNGTDGYVEIL
ncbi:MAG TPA: phosphoenolpyruvate synthase [Pyrinomonadaceae bacterium]|nr:phosphoenolpyruvate synthase [Pyrinomonadaceae bacterium]